MVILSSQDLYQVRFASLVADYDRRTLVDLYMPIVGYAAISIYFTLWAMGEKESMTMVYEHESLLNMMQMPTGKFIEERKKLEGIGLLKTCIHKEDDINYYTYEIYAPKTPAKFFADTLLFGLLIKYVGEATATKLKTCYSINIDKDAGNDISATFAEVFHPDFKDQAFQKAFRNKKVEVLDRVQSKVKSEFNYETFIELVRKSSPINKAVFTKKILKEVDRLSALYGIDEETAAMCFIDCFDADKPTGHKVDLDKLSEMFQDEIKFPFLLNKNNNKSSVDKINSNTELARLINIMEDASCKEFLSLKQNGKAPVKADLKLVDDISVKQGLKPAVINAIVDYTLQTNGNVLSRNLVEKIAASVAREGLETAYDTMVFLKKKPKRSKKESYKQYSHSEPIKKENEVKPKSDSSSNGEIDDTLQKILEEIGG